MESFYILEIYNPVRELRKAYKLHNNSRIKLVYDKVRIIIAVIFPGRKRAM